MPTPDKNKKQISQEPQRIKLTARVSMNSYNAITEIQRIHRTKTGKALPLYQILDTAILAYAEKHNIKTRP